MSVQRPLKMLMLLNRNVHQKRCATFLSRAPSAVRCEAQRALCLTHWHNSTQRGLKHVEEGVLKRTIKSVKFYVFDRFKLKAVGYFLYETIADRLLYSEFFNEMELPDTFNSWFLITELHVWMLMVKAMDLGNEGRYLRNFIVEAMWADVTIKCKKLGVEHFSVARDQIQVLADQFQAGIISYDEGLLSDDKALASALWRRFFESNCKDPKYLEVMVKYVRQQMQTLDNLSLDDFKARKLTWLPLDNT